MRKCLIVNKPEYEALLNVYMISQGVLRCKYHFCEYSGKRVTRESLYWRKLMVYCVRTSITEVSGLRRRACIKIGKESRFSE